MTRIVCRTSSLRSPTSGNPESRISRVIGIGNAAVWATFAAALSEIPVQLEPRSGSFKGDDQDFIDKFFVPGIQRAGGLRAAEMLIGSKAK